MKGILSNRNNCRRTSLGSVFTSYHIVIHMVLFQKFTCQHALYINYAAYLKGAEMHILSEWYLNAKLILKYIGKRMVITQDLDLTEKYLYMLVSNIFFFVVLKVISVIIFGPFRFKIVVIAGYGH